MEDFEILKGKFSNIFIKIVFGLMKNDLSEIRHYLSNDVYNMYQSVVDNNIKNNELPMYDLLNVKSISLVDSYEKDDSYYVKVLLVSRYMDYVVDKDTLKYKRGEDSRRIEKNHYLTFKKLKSATERKNVIKCEYCGANLDINSSGVCEYCGKVADVSNYDYILVEADYI